MLCPASPNSLSAASSLLQLSLGVALVLLTNKGIHSHLLDGLPSVRQLTSPVCPQTLCEAGRSNTMVHTASGGGGMVTSACFGFRHKDLGHPEPAMFDVEPR